MAVGCWVCVAGSGGCWATGLAVVVAVAGSCVVFLTTWLGVFAAAACPVVAFSSVAFSAAGEPLALGSLGDAVGRSGAAVSLAVFWAAVFFDVVGFFAIAGNLRGLLASNVHAGRLPSHWARGHWVGDQRTGGLSMPDASLFAVYSACDGAPGLSTIPARGGNLSNMECGRFIHGTGSAMIDPGPLATPLPPKSSASELKISW
jgi:hypothetical protein